MEKEAFMDRLLAFMKEEAYKPLTIQELEEMLNIKEADGFKELVKALVALEETGQIVRTRSNRYGLPEKNEFSKRKNFRACEGLRVSAAGGYLFKRRVYSAERAEYGHERRYRHGAAQFPVKRIETGRHGHPHPGKKHRPRRGHIHRNEKLRLCHPG